MGVDNLPLGPLFLQYQDSLFLPFVPEHPKKVITHIYDWTIRTNGFPARVRSIDLIPEQEYARLPLQLTREF